MRGRRSDVYRAWRQPDTVLTFEGSMALHCNTDEIAWRLRAACPTKTKVWNPGSCGACRTLQRIKLLFYQWKEAAGHEPVDQSATSANDDLELRPVQRADGQQCGRIALHGSYLSEADDRSATGAIQTLISCKRSVYVGRCGTPRFAEPGRSLPCLIRS